MCEEGKGNAMEDIMEQYGAGLLQMLGGIGMLAVFGKMMQAGGMLSMFLLHYMKGICG